MVCRSLMFQGTGSDVGKSLLVAGLCRLLARRGIKVAPFKPQNMSNNAAVADDGGEIGRAQYLQAMAARVAPSIHMNPVLLKPQADRNSQVIVQGKVAATMGAKEYLEYRKTLLPRVVESYNTLAKNSDIILVEGAGSPAEINLRDGDIANMGFARAVNIPVVLIGDIERGGVIASIVGTHAILDAADRDMIQAFIVNKFRGDASIFTPGANEIVTRTGWKNFGLIPHFAELAKLPQEDSLALGNNLRSSAAHAAALNGSSRFAPPVLHIVILQTPHIANFDDIDPLANEPNIKLTWCEAGVTIPADADIIILAGSKSTIADLAFIRAQGWDVQMQSHRKRGKCIIGICGGYQMLGKTISDPYGMEGTPETVAGLGLLDCTTTLTTEKTVSKFQGKFTIGLRSNAAHAAHRDGASPRYARPEPIEVSGYEIHLGETVGESESADGLVWGSYIHGLFANDTFRNSLLGINSTYNYKGSIQKILDSWADILEKNIPIEELLSLSS